MLCQYSNVSFQRQNARIIVGNFWEQDAIKVLCAAYHEGLYGSKYVWILPGSYYLCFIFIFITFGGKPGKLLILLVSKGGTATSYPQINKFYT